MISSKGRGTSRCHGQHPGNREGGCFKEKVQASVSRAPESHVI